MRGASNAPTLCGVPVSAFKEAPSPAELGRIVADMFDHEQAEFFMAMAESLHNACGESGSRTQMAAAGASLVLKEAECCDGKASSMIGLLAWALL